MPFVLSIYNNILLNCQHGFRKGLSCETQLCATYHELAKAAEQSTAVHAVVLDFQKAFDKVPHKILMDKIRKIENIDPYIANWVQDLRVRSLGLPYFCSI